MSKDMMRRLAAVEAGKVEMPPELRQWLGDPITHAERAAVAPWMPITAEEDEAAIRAMPADLRAWYECRDVATH